MRMTSIAIVILALVGLAGCGSSAEDGCAEDQVELHYLGGERDGDVVCAARPASCGDPASCADNTCLGAMYGLCEGTYSGVGCSDTFAPPLVSCNP